MNKVIHHCIVIYLALIVLIRMMAMPISLISYSLNKNYITENLCENRFKSEIHCAGTCYLNKQLARANDNQNTQDRQGTVKILIIDFFESIAQPQFGCNPIARISSIRHKRSMDERKLSRPSFSSSHLLRSIFCHFIVIR
ncbi:MAG: hypothetical protein WDM78_20395 [Puia sp.]